MSDEISEEVMQDIIELIYSHQKIMACKKYRELRGTSLLEAKQFVEQLTEKLKAEAPENFSQTTKSGCMGVILLALTAFASLIGVVLRFNACG
jgi:ribosomal protein L7/L12